MQRHRQTKVELILKLGEVSTDWKDEFAQTFVDYLTDFNIGESVTINDLKSLLEINFEAGITLFLYKVGHLKVELKLSTLNGYYEKNRDSQKRRSSSDQSS
ncbi:hypothetical protein V8V91_17075 [Algoriphagus halophilus]|uniref:hypothetical protein n=1 Tax=Algoriphagus halophilus TaxID=226505 RepID=UPI00358F8BCF